MKFHVDALHNYARDKKGTDGRVNHYMPPFGGIKSKHEHPCQNWGLTRDLLHRSLEFYHSATESTKQID